MSERESLFDALQQRADELKELKENWDSYGSTSPDPESLDFAVALGVALDPFFTSPPSLVPLSDGSAQIEWHSDGWEIEMVIERYKPRTAE